ncbi:hypothetical protein [Agromyces bracchium]|uniref:DUF4386 family protein n=1 Tax=Agromyces bracchium TaxID=88376 RepID=A0A6I3M530_9MICO|nr:hypothetical protein [Agromyces bracchium]MTH67202.1 hypothetical protein [Agromyces bracchium]
MSTRADDPVIPTTTTRRRFQPARLIGAAFLVSFGAGVVIFSLPPYVYEGSSLDDFAAAHADDVRLNLTSLLGMVLFPLAGILLVWAAAFLRRSVDVGRVTPSIGGQVGVVGAAITAVGAIVAGAASSAGAHVAAGTLDGGFPPAPEAGYGLEMLASQVFNPATTGLSVLMVAFGVTAWRSRRLPRWLAWAGFVIAPLVPIAWMLGMFPLLFAVVWVAVATVVVDTEPQG